MKKAKKMASKKANAASSMVAKKVKKVTGGKRVMRKVGEKQPGAVMDKYGVKPNIPEMD